MTDEEMATAFDAPEIQALTERYQAAAHAMQTGVEFLQDKTNQTPKHLRVGVNSAMVDAAAVALALMRKGVITPLEYATALADKMEEEAASFEKQVNAQHGGGAKIRLR